MAERRVRGRGARGALVAGLLGLAGMGAGGALAVGPAGAAVQPDPGNAAAWASGLALLADSPGALALFDQPACLFPADPRARLALGVARARPFGFAPLARGRAAAAVVRGAWAVGAGLEAYGPDGARRTRAGLAAAWRGRTADGALAIGAAWHEARLEGSAGRRGSGALDAGVVLERAGGAIALATRALAAGGAPAAQADPDWTAEARVDVAPARVHVALTHDLAGTRLGGGLGFAAGPCVVQAGAFGAPWTFGFGMTWRGARATLGMARAQHPALGASDAWEGGLAW